jgi:dihydrofolate reductase
MRKLIVSNAMSLDGYYEGPGKNVMALFDYRSDYPTDESFDAYNTERLRAADTLLGRTSYDGFKGFWPSVADDPNATPLQREISRLNNAIDKVVISDSMTSEETNPWHNTRIISRADAHEQLAELKRQPGRERSWFLVAEHCGSTDNLTNTLIIRIRADHREITLV